MQANGPNLLLIRRYRSIDQDAVCTLHQMALEAVGAYAKGPQGSLLNADLNDIESVYLNCRGEFLVGSIRNRIVAMGALKCLGSHAAEITRMRVHPNYWRRGYGEAILHRLESAAATLGYNELWLDTLPIQTAARHLYRKNGFEEVLCFYVRGYDEHEAILFRKALPTMQIG